MKFLFSFILLLSFKVFSATKTELVYYFLKCPNGQQITSVELDLEKESFHVDYSANGRTNFTPWSVNFENSDPFLKGSHTLENKVVWKEGIHFIPSNLGLPEKINGCDVVPFVVYIDEIGYVGSNDDYSTLDKYSRLIFNFHFEDKNRAKVIFSDKYKVLPPREKYFFVNYYVCLFYCDNIDYSYGGFLYNLGSSYDLKIYVSNSLDTIVDIASCTWWDENTPQACSAMLGRNKSFYLENIEFWKNGVIKKANLERYGSWPKDWNNPKGEKIYCDIGLISYRYNGEIESCVIAKESL